MSEAQRNTDPLAIPRDHPEQDPTEEPDNTDRISDFARRTRELGRYIKRQVLDRARDPVEPQDREMMIQWTLEARNHSPDPDALDVGYLQSDRPLDYHMLGIVYQQHSDLVRDRDG